MLTNGCRCAKCDGKRAAGGAVAVAVAGASLQEALLPARALERVERHAAAGRRGLGAARDVTLAAEDLALRRVLLRASLLLLASAAGPVRCRASALHRGEKLDCILCT